MLCRASDVSGADRQTAIPLDRARALDVLRPCQSDVRLVLELRTLISKQWLVAPLTDREVFEQLARQIESRDLLVLRFRSAVREGGGGGGAAKEAEPAEETAPAPAPRRRTGGGGGAAEGTVLPDNLDDSRMAASSKQAAESGVPFCEQ
jgi:hypothetical protein